MSESWVPVDVAHLLNRQHPLLRGCVGWWLVLPHWRGGTTLRNLVGPEHATLEGMSGPLSATSGWNQTARRGGFGELRLVTDDRITVPSATKYSFTSGGQDQPLTISCCAWFNDITATAGVMAKWQDFASQLMEWILYTSSGGLFWELYENPNADGIGRTVTMTTGAYQNQWITLTCTYTGSETPGGCAIYRNGARVDTADTLFGDTYTGMQATAAEVSFGAYSGAANFLDGRLDDLRIWNRVLPPREVMELYQNQLAGYEGLVQRLPLPVGRAFAGRAPEGRPLRIWRKGGGV